MQFIKSYIVAISLLIFSSIVLFGQQQSTQFNEKKITQIDVNIYPNPVEDYFHLSTIENIKFISINNIAGKEVKKFVVRGSMEYSISDLRKGIYIVRIFDTHDEPVKVVRLSKS